MATLPISASFKGLPHQPGTRGKGGWEQSALLCMHNFWQLFFELELFSCIFWQDIEMLYIKIHSFWGGAFLDGLNNFFVLET